MELLPSELQDLSLLRRLLFAVVYLPKDLPQYWFIVGKFVSQGADCSLEPEKCRVAAENLKLMNEKAFVKDDELTDEIHQLHVTPEANMPLGIVLISPHTTCRFCNGKLLVRHDRPSTLTVYTESYGTIIGTHYHKYCQHFRKGCTFKQHYGYSTKSAEGKVMCSYDFDWEKQTYVISSAETAFELIMLKRYDVELLSGQLSYSQKAEIYNNINGYPVPFKQCTTLKKEELPAKLDNKYVFNDICTTCYVLFINQF